MRAIVPLSVLLVLACTVVWSRWASPGARARAVHGFARTVDLELDPALTDRVAARLARRDRAGVVSGLVLAVATVSVVLAQGGPELVDQLLPLLVGFAYVAGHAVAVGGVAWWEAARPAPSGSPRLARASTPSLGDYVARHERSGSWVLAGISAAVATGVAVLAGAGHTGPVPGPLLALTLALPAATSLGAELVGRRLLQRRQAAATPLELAWDDALRARTLRDLVSVPIVAGLYLPVSLLGTVAGGLEGGWPANPVAGLVTGAVAVLLLGAGVMGVVSLVLSPARHFRERLWPARPEAPGAQGVAAIGGTS